MYLNVFEDNNNHSVKEPYFIIYLPQILPILPRYFTIKSALTDFTTNEIPYYIVHMQISIHTRNDVVIDL